MTLYSPLPGNEVSLSQKESEKLVVGSRLDHVPFAMENHWLLAATRLDALFVFPALYVIVLLFVSVLLPVESEATPLDSSYFQYDVGAVTWVLVACDVPAVVMLPRGSYVFILFNGT